MVFLNDCFFPLNWTAMSFIPLVCVLFPSVCSVSLYIPVFRFLVASLVRPAKVHMALSSSPSDGLLGGVAEEIHVLAVDDSIVDRKLIEKLLKNFHFKVTTAENALRALEYLGIGDTKDSGESKEIKINMIITDYCMPGMTGYELLKKIKESSTMKEIPVVIMSSENIPTRINKCLEEGAQEFMLKPIQQSDVNKLRCQMSKLSKSCSGRICLGR